MKKRPTQRPENHYKKPLVGKQGQRKRKSSAGPLANTDVFEAEKQYNVTIL